MHQLDEAALNVELVLISIIEGVALAALASDVSHLFTGELHLLPLIFAASGLALLLVFWSQAILHAVSFIRWPLEMGRMLLYFLAAFLQVLAYGFLTNNMAWFIVWAVFSVLVLGIYAIDLGIIKDMRPYFEKLPEGPSYVAEVLRRHTYEMTFLVPLSIAFNLVALAALYFFGSHSMVALALGILQLVIALGALADCLRNFRKRSALLPKLFG